MPPKRSAPIKSVTQEPEHHLNGESEGVFADECEKVAKKAKQQQVDNETDQVDDVSFYYHVFIF